MQKPLRSLQELSRLWPATPQRNCTFMNSASGLRLHFPNMSEVYTEQRVEQGGATVRREVFAVSEVPEC